MVSENIVLSILKSSITGAGLVLALYSLVFRSYKTLAGFRNIERQRGLLRAKSLAEAYIEPTDEELGEIVESFAAVPARRVPFHQGYGLIITFVGFIISSLMAIFWLFGFNLVFFYNILIFIFFSTVVIFGIIGLLLMLDMLGILVAEYESRPPDSEPREELTEEE